MKKIIKTTHAPSPIGPYNQAVKAGDFLYVSGQIAIDSTSGALVTGNVENETKQVMKNIAAILNEAGYSFADIIKTSIFLSDMSLFAQVNEVYGAYFSTDFPARETVAVAGLPKDVNVEISVVAYRQ